MSENSKRYVGVNLPEDLFDWVEETRKHENRKRGNQIIQLLYEVRAARQAAADKPQANVNAGGVNAMTLEQSRHWGQVK